ncbi:MAG: ArsC/Spx/MgsR family protein [Pseudomonadota bacterium]|nr:ArsC/Spx/MgsR family protein [Pseudomonadota bacterium]
MVIIFGLKNCDSCRKALAFFGRECKFIDIRKEGFDIDSKKKVIEQFGEKLINRRSRTWRELKTKERAKSLSQIISDHPSVVKRPVIFFYTDIFLGWNKELETNFKIGQLPTSSS